VEIAHPSRPHRAAADLQNAHRHRLQHVVGDR
jgi:hypothetical protein